MPTTNREKFPTDTISSVRGIFDKETEVCLLLFLGIMVEYRLGGWGMHGVIYSELRIDRPGFDQRREIVYSRWLALVARVRIAIS